MLDTFYLEGSMYNFENVIVEINKAFSVGLIYQGLKLNQFINLKTGEIDPSNN